VSAYDHRIAPRPTRRNRKDPAWRLATGFANVETREDRLLRSIIGSERGRFTLEAMVGLVLSIAISVAIWSMFSFFGGVDTEVKRQAALRVECSRATVVEGLIAPIKINDTIWFMQEGPTALMRIPCKCVRLMEFPVEFSVEHDAKTVEYSATIQPARPR
jgi:hypothetical protein